MREKRGVRGRRADQSMIGETEGEKDRLKKEEKEREKEME